MDKHTTMEGDTVDLIAFNKYGRTKGTTEAILRANTGLAAAGTALPAGMVILLPETVSEPEKVAVRIWS
jgi:phage tail protein X